MKKFIGNIGGVFGVLGILFLIACLFGGIDQDYNTPGRQDSLPDFITFWHVYGVGAFSALGIIAWFAWSDL